MKHLPPITEAAFQKMVLALAKLHGWRSAHFRPGMNARGKWQTAVAGDGVGFVDLVLCHDGKGGHVPRVLFVELKTDAGKVRPEQREWLRWLNAAGGTAVVWRPGMWEAIERELAG
jgi:hypothetical protein